MLDHDNWPNKKSESRESPRIPKILLWGTLPTSVVGFRGSAFAEAIIAGDETPRSGLSDSRKRASQKPLTGVRGS